MSLSYCAELVKSADEDRFLSVMAAMPDFRAVLFPLYALNVEISNAAWASNEPMLCQMRLQYLRDLIAAIYAQEALPDMPLAAPLSEVIGQGGLVQQQLFDLVDARLWDLEREPFGSADHFSRYLEQTAGNLMAMAARLTGVPEHFDTAVRAHGVAMGLAKFLIAVPELKAHNRVPLRDETPEALAKMAARALQGIKNASGQKISGGQAALRAGWDTTRVLRLVVRQPDRVLAGRLLASPFRRKTSLLVMSLRG